MKKWFKITMWKIFVKKGWYQITWNGGAYDIKDRLFYDGKEFRYMGGRADVDGMSWFVKRLGK